MGIGAERLTRLGATAARDLSALKVCVPPIQGKFSTEFAEGRVVGSTGNDHWEFRKDGAKPDRGDHVVSADLGPRDDVARPLTLGQLSGEVFPGAGE